MVLYSWVNGEVEKRRESFFEMGIFALDIILIFNVQGTENGKEAKPFTLDMACVQRPQRKEGSADYKKIGNGAVLN